MLKRIAAGLATTAVLLHGTSALAATEYKIVTASERGTYIQIGRDLAQFVAPRPTSLSRCCLRPDRSITCAACVTSRG